MKLSKEPRHFARKPKSGMQLSRHPGGRPNASGMSSTSFFNLFKQLFGSLSVKERQKRAIDPFRYKKGA